MAKIQISMLVLGLIGFIFAILLAFLSKKLKVEENPLVEKVLKSLPGINCGVCGFSGCRAFAEQAVHEKKIFSGCLAGGSAVNEILLKILDINVDFSYQKIIAICHCGADNTIKKHSHIYQGPNTCKAAHLIGGGTIDCLYGCLGFGDCVSICPVKAISVEKEKINIDVKKCIRCGRCVKNCPRNLFELIPFDPDVFSFYVACKNKDKGNVVKKVCFSGCITCGVCTKVKGSPFYIDDNLSNIDYTRISELKPLEDAKNKCPTKCILNVKI